MEKPNSLNALPRLGMTIERRTIKGLWRLIPEPAGDERGFFVETFRQSLIASEMGRPYVFAQSNHSRSVARTLRGFRTEPWDKAIYVTRGTALVVVVDPRPDSPTYRAHETFLIGDAPGDRHRIVVSRGLANAFYCLTDVDYVNDVSEEYRPTGRRGFHWSAPGLGIDWPDTAPILSNADANLPSFDVFVEGRR